MRKKYLSALLFGALLFASAGTFTSCKDYDDDIKNLQEQVDGLATKEDMEAKLAQMQTAIDAAKKTAEEALAKAEEAGQGGEGGEGVDQAEINKLKDRIAALEEAMAKVEEMKNEIKDMVDGQLDGFRKEMQDLIKEVEDLTGYSLTMVTGVSFVYPEKLSYLDKNHEYDTHLEVNYARIEKTVEFGKGLTGAFIAKKGDVNTVPANMLVKVDPVNSVVTSDMLSLVNGKGENLSNFVDVTSAKWSGNLSTRANSETGLYNVGVQLKSDVDFEAFDKMVLPESGEHDPNGCNGKHEYNLFALSVNDAEKSRVVTSDYKVTLHVQEEQKAGNIDGSILTSSAASGEIKKYGGNDEIVGNFPVVSGEPFTLDVKGEEYKGKVMASYVVIDWDADLSDTDIAAIKGLKISGTDNVIRTNTHSLSISGDAGVAVPFKLVTIDYHGNVTDATFSVKISTPALMTSEFVMTPSKYVDVPKAWSLSNPSAADMQEFKIPEGTNKYEISLAAGEKYGDNQEDYSKFTNSLNFNNNGGLVDNQGNSILKLYKSDKKTTASANKDVAYAAFTGTLNLQGMREDKSYSGVIKFFKDDKFLGSNTITVTKKLPTDVPADFAAKTNTIANGVMTIYPKPGVSNYATGEYLLSNSFINWTAIGRNGLGYGLSIDGVTNTNPVKAKFNGANPSINEINYALLGDGKTYPSVVSYNYGEIKFVAPGHGVVGSTNHTVEWSTKFGMKFGYWPADCDYSWSAADAEGYMPEVVYGKDTEILGKPIMKDGKVTGYENVVKVLSPYGVVVNPFTDASTSEWTTWAKNLVDANVTLVTEGNNNENEFFKAKFYQNYNKVSLYLTKDPSTTTVLENDVVVKVVIKFTDKFGKETQIPTDLKIKIKKDNK